MSTLPLTPRVVLDERREEMRHVLKSFGVVRAGVFGSIARRSDHLGSDIDLIVQFAPTATRDLIRLAERLGEVAGMPVDVVDADRVFERARSTGIGTSILRDAVPL